MKTNDPLSEEDCYRLFTEYGTLPHIIRHCAAVSRVATNVARALRDAGMDMDPDLAGRAALLHDLVRTRENHAEEAADIVGRYDRAAADIIRVHMHYDMVKDVASMSETDVVTLADRSVLEDRYVGHEKRMEEMISRFAGNLEAVKFLRGKLRETSALVSSIEKFLGRPLEAVACGD